MKLAVLIGAAHMMLGLILKGINLIHYEKWIEAWTNYVPKVLLMLSFLGYVGTLIIMKWSTDWIEEDRDPPSIIACLINIFIPNADKDQDTFMENAQDQSMLNNFVCLCLCASMTLMLFLKPIFMFIQVQSYAEFFDQPNVILP